MNTKAFYSSSGVIQVSRKPQDFKLIFETLHVPWTHGHVRAPITFRLNMDLFSNVKKICIAIKWLDSHHPR